MPRKGQKDVNSIKEQGSTESAVLGPSATEKGKGSVRAESEEIPRAEIVVESEREMFADETMDVPLFRTESVGANSRSSLNASEAGGKIAAPKKSTTPSIPGQASDASPQLEKLSETGFSSELEEQYGAGFPEIQPPLAILAIAFLVLMFLLW